MRLIMCLLAGLLAGCSDQPAEPTAANEAVAAKPEKVPHCFFKDSETKDWSAKVRGGQAVVTGRGSLRQESLRLARPAPAGGLTGHAALEKARPCAH